MSEREITQINICRREYKIASDEWQPLYIQRLAELLNNEISIVEKETGLVDSYNLLILASLRIMDRLLNEEKNKSGNIQVGDDELDNLSSQIENIL